MSQSYGLYSVKGSDEVFADFRTDKRVGRVDFQFLNLDGDAVSVIAEEMDNAGVSKELSTLDLASKSQGTLSVTSSKPRIRLKSGSGNTGNAQVRVDSNFLTGAIYGGNIATDYTSKKESFDGPNLTPGE